MLDRTLEPWARAAEMGDAADIPVAPPPAVYAGDVVL